MPAPALVPALLYTLLVQKAVISNTPQQDVIRCAGVSISQFGSIEAAPAMCSATRKLLHRPTAHAESSHQKEMS